MIDTDKYEGHTPAPWTWRGETIDGDGEVNHTVCYMEHPHVNGEMNEADAQLIADAPLLLAEVKRLDAIVRDIESLIPENPDYVCEQILGACHRYMYPEEFGEVIE
jgi:hypothetical protein